MFKDKYDEDLANYVSDGLGMSLTRCDKIIEALLEKGEIER